MKKKKDVYEKLQKAINKKKKKIIKKHIKVRKQIKLREIKASMLEKDNLKSNNFFR